MSKGWNGWLVTVYDKEGNVESRERHKQLRDVADVVAAYVGEQIVNIKPALSPEQKKEMERHAFTNMV